MTVRVAAVDVSGAGVLVILLEVFFVSPVELAATTGTDSRADRCDGDRLGVKGGSGLVDLVSCRS